MRKAINITIVILLIILLLPGCGSDTTAADETAQPSPSEPTVTETLPELETAQPTGGPSAEPIIADGTYETPLDLFSGVLNPFSDIDFPESYTPYKADVSLKDGLYELSFLTEDPEVVFFAASLLGVTDEGDIAALTQALQSGRMQEAGIYGDAIQIEITIKPVEADSDYYTEAAGYTITLLTEFDEDMLVLYRQILQENISVSAFQSAGAEELIDRFDLGSGGGLTVVTGSVNYINASFNFDLGDDFDQWSDYFESAAYLEQGPGIYWGEKNVSLFLYGELETRVTLQPESNSVNFSQEIGSTDVNISDYAPPLSLVMVGFDKMGNFTSEDGSIYVGIRKEIFGDTDEGDGGVNYIQYNDDSGGYDCFLVKYFRLEGKYYVQIQKDGLKAEYWYDAFENKYTDMDGGEDIGELKEAMQTIGNTDADMVMGEPIHTFEQYILDTFGVNSDALYDLPLK